jgi:predicted ATPase
MATLKRLEIKGYRSIKDACLELCKLNVLIGANGAGKSNFVSFFKMLNEMLPVARVRRQDRTRPIRPSFR